MIKQLSICFNTSYLLNLSNLLYLIKFYITNNIFKMRKNIFFLSVMEGPYSRSVFIATRNNIFIITGYCFTSHNISMIATQLLVLCLGGSKFSQSSQFHQTIYLLSLVITRLKTIRVWPGRTVPCIVSWWFHILTVSSFQPNNIFIIANSCFTSAPISMLLQHSFLHFVLEVPYSHSLIWPTRNNIFAITGDCYANTWTRIIIFELSFLCFGLEVPYSHSTVRPTRNNIFVITGDYYTRDPSSIAL